MIGSIRLRSSRAASSFSRASAASTAAESRRARTRLDALDLLLLERRVDPVELELRLVLELVAVDADDDPLLRSRPRTGTEARLGDLALEEVLLDRGDDAAELLDPVEVVVGLPLELVRQAARGSTSRRAGRSCSRRRSRARSPAACAARAAPHARSAARAPRRSCSCAATASRRARPRAPRSPCGRGSPPAAAPSATHPRSGCGSASASERGSFAPYLSRISVAQIRRAARYFAISSKKSRCALKKKDSRGAKSSTSSPRSIAHST